jgi:hemerythrin-like domain-containing protein
MKATEFLRKQHREVMKLFKEVEKTEAPRERKRLMTDIANHLKVHTTIEEEIFYPAVKEIGTEKAEDMMLEAVEEHHVVDLVLEELPQVDPAADTFEAKMTVLKELIEHHVEEEEQDLFPRVEKKLGDEKLEQLGKQMKTRFAEVQTTGFEETAPRGFARTLADLEKKLSLKAPKKRAA